HFDSDRASLGTYLYAITRNLCYKRLRMIVPEVSPESLKEEPWYDRDPLKELLATEVSTQVTRAVAGLPEFQREAILLFEFGGCTLAEIAIITEADVGTVKSRLHRARLRLRKELAPYLKKDPVRVVGEE